MRLSLARHRLATPAFIALALFAAAPARAADFQIDGLRLAFGSFSIAIPKIEVKGSTLEREAFVALFNGAGGEPAASRMGRLNAASISAPEITFEYKVGPQTQVTSYKDVSFSDIRDGRIARGESARATLKVTGAQGGAPAAAGAGSAMAAVTRKPAGEMSGEMKRTAFEGFDVKHLARVLTERAPVSANAPMQPIFERFDQEGYSFDLGPDGKLMLGPSVARDFSAKVGEEPLGEVFAKLVAMGEAAEKATKEPAVKTPSLDTAEERRTLLAVLSLYESISYGSGEARDLVMTVSVPPKPGAKAEMVEIKLARIAYGSDAPAKSGVAIEGLSFSGGGAKGLLDSFSHSGYSAAPVLAALREELLKPTFDFDSLDFRKFIPVFGTMRMSGLTVDVPQEARRGQPAPAPLKVALGLLELKVGEQLNGIPTATSLTIDNLVAPVVEGAGNPSARDLIAMGYRSIDFSGKLDLAWDAARSEVAIRDITLGAAGMGRLSAQGTLGNVTKDVFASDLALAQVAALGATARRLEARLTNQGLYEKLIENEARKAKRKPEELRQQFAMMANLGLAAILGPSDAAKTLTAAVSRFVAKPGSLTVEATAKGTSGLGLADVITMTDPTEIFDKIELKANAE